jgi:K+-transporting ATPase KdpF subunit
MCTKVLSGIVGLSSSAAGSDNNISYLTGGVIALLILGYLVYTLLHPEKF